MAEVLIFKRKLTPAERFEVGTYLNWRYSLVSDAPTTPANLSAFAVSSDQISLAWSSPFTNSGTIFSVQRATNGGIFNTVAALENANSYLDTGLLSGTEYIYRVMAADYAGVSGCSTETNVATLASGTGIPLGALKAWVKADSGHGGNSVSCWVDQTANGNNATIIEGTSTVSWQPFYVAEAINGQPAFLFSHTNGLRFSVWFMTDWTEGEVFAVLKSLGTLTTGDERGLWLFGNDNNDTLYPIIDTEGVGICNPNITNKIHECSAAPTVRQ